MRVCFGVSLGGVLFWPSAPPPRVVANATSAVDALQLWPCIRTRQTRWLFLSAILLRLCRCVCTVHMLPVLARTPRPLRAPAVRLVRLRAVLSRVWSGCVALPLAARALRDIGPQGGFPLAWRDS